jgi:hypothetical protein
MSILLTGHARGACLNHPSHGQAVIPVAPQSRPTGVRALVPPARRPGLRAVTTAAAVRCRSDPHDDQDQRDHRCRGDGNYQPGHVESNVAKYRPEIPPSGVHDIMTLSPLP